MEQYHQHLQSSRGNGSSEREQQETAAHRMLGHRAPSRTAEPFKVSASVAFWVTQSPLTVLQWLQQE